MAVPLLSAIFPIRRALRTNLSDSLDTRHSKTQAVKIDISRSEDRKGFSWPVVLLGIGMAGYGFGIYFVFPLRSGVRG
jgi:hypothetical protein